VVLCVGETQAAREAGEQEAYIRRQLQEVLAGLSLPPDSHPTQAAPPLPRLMIAYEPLWAIGTGQLPSGTDITAMSATGDDRCLADGECAHHRHERNDPC
jgi:triosephosphate isomerase